MRVIASRFQSDLGVPQTAAWTSRTVTYFDNEFKFPIEIWSNNFRFPPVTQLGPLMPVSCFAGVQSFRNPAKRSEHGPLMPVSAQRSEPGPLMHVSCFAAGVQSFRNPAERSEPGEHSGSNSRLGTMAQRLA